MGRYAALALCLILAFTLAFAGNTDQSTCSAISPGWKYFPNNAILNAGTEPNDVRPGDRMRIFADVYDFRGIRSVFAEMPHEKGFDILPMRLVSGTRLGGRWEAEWLVHDTVERGYESRIVAESESGKVSEKRVYWTDPPAMSPGDGCMVTYISSTSFSADVGSTASVGCRCDSADAGVGYYEDNSSGTFSTIPEDDTDIDSGGGVLFHNLCPISAGGAIAILFGRKLRIFGKKKKNDGKDGGEVKK